LTKFLSLSFKFQKFQISHFIVKLFHRYSCYQSTFNRYWCSR